MLTRSHGLLAAGVGVIEEPPHVHVPGVLEGDLREAARASSACCGSCRPLLVHERRTLGPRAPTRHRHRRAGGRRGAVAVAARLPRRRSSDPGRSRVQVPWFACASRAPSRVRVDRMPPSSRECAPKGTGRSRCDIFATSQPRRIGRSRPGRARRSPSSPWRTKKSISTGGTLNLKVSPSSRTVAITRSMGQRWNQATSPSWARGSNVVRQLQVVHEERVVLESRRRLHAIADRARGHGAHSDLARGSRPPPRTP